MRGRPRHAKPTMTRAQNAVAFMVWRAGCSDDALAGASPVSIARSYGLDINFVASEIAKEADRRRIVAALNALRLGEPL